jgi:hypothetical protein
MLAETEEKLNVRLAKMRSAVNGMQVAGGKASDVVALWIDFIIAAGSFYSIMEQASKSTNAGKFWFGKKKHERKRDPLLQYIRQARNAEEHGVHSIAVVRSSKVELRSHGAEITLESDGVDTWRVVGQKGDIAYANDIAKLLRVYDDRSRKWYEPPTQHLGQTIPDQSAITIAGLALVYIEAMIAEAKATQF